MQGARKVDLSGRKMLAPYGMDLVKLAVERSEERRAAVVLATKVGEKPIGVKVGIKPIDR